MLIASEVIKNSGIQFGTSGARGLVSQFIPEVCAAFTLAFVGTMNKLSPIRKVAIGIDNRPSSQNIARACAAALQSANISYVYYGVIPTPALAYAAMQEGISCIMVTGSHIPFDRNGLKFYTPSGEITKSDESYILSSNYAFAPIDELPDLLIDNSAALMYERRYINLFNNNILSGKKIGVYEHSSAGRDIYIHLFRSLGAEVISLGRSDDFVPIDTEAVSEEDMEKALFWSKKYKLDAIFSTDGDGDRPLVADENGRWIRGDILGLLSARQMNIEALAIPVSCNSIIDRCLDFAVVEHTKIGSPYVIEALSKLSDRYQPIAGFEANGGYILGSDVTINGAILKALPTRDAVLPALMLFFSAKDKCISSLVHEWELRQTYSDRIKNFPNENSNKIIQYGVLHTQEFLSLIGFSEEQFSSVDLTDGLRIFLSSGDIIHLRASGNAPELRCYAESTTVIQAKELVNRVLSNVVLIDTSLFVN